jgi:hypothetical protein
MADDEWGFSHLLVDEATPKRSGKVLYAIAAGVWVLSHRWLLDVNEGTWEPPTPGKDESGSLPSPASPTHYEAYAPAAR